MRLPGCNQLGWWRLRRQLNQLQLLVLDVDGVLTDGGLWFDADGQLIKRLFIQKSVCAWLNKIRFLVGLQFFLRKR